MNENINSRIDRLEQNEKKKKQIIAVTVIILVVIFFTGVFWGAKRVLQTEETQEPEAEHVASLTAILETSQGKIDFLNNLVLDTADCSRTKLSVSTALDIPDDSIKAEPEDEKMLTAIKYMKDDMLSSVLEKYPSKAYEFNEDFADELIPVAFTENDLISADCKEGSVAEDGTVEDADYYFLTFKFCGTAYPPSANNALYVNFNMGAKEKILESLKTEISSMASVDASKITCNGFEINAKSNRLTDKLEYINYVRGYDVELTLTFKGDFAALGTRKISFSFTSTDKFSFTWAGVKLDMHELSLEKGGTDTIMAFRTPEEDVVVTWTSSNEDIATVDEDGYVKGRKTSAEPAIITASFEHLGHTYSDTCEVYVTIPVKSIVISKENLKLKVGETAALSAEISPEDATIKGMLWYTDDEAVASVDKNGVVTATGAGETTVYVLSADGYFKSSCTVTVTE